MHSVQRQACTLAQGYSVPGAGLAFVFIELHEISVSSLLWPVLNRVAALPSSLLTVPHILVLTAWSVFHCHPDCL